MTSYLTIAELPAILVDDVLDTDQVLIVRPSTKEIFLYGLGSDLSAATPDPGPTYDIGLSASLLAISGELDAWTEQTIDLSAYEGATVKLIFKYQNGNAGNSYQGDIQLDLIATGSDTFDFESTDEGFETSSAFEADYGSVSWGAVGTGTTGGKWNRDGGGTPSGGTGRTDAGSGSFYLYCETSSPTVVNSLFWLRSPEIIIPASCTLSFFEARLGGNIGTLDVYLDVIS